MVFSLGLSSGGFGGSGGFGSNFGSVANNINQSSPFNSPSPIAFAPSPLPLLPPPLPTPVAPPPPVVAAPPPPPPVAPPPPVTPPPVVETPVTVAPVNPVADPVDPITVVSNPVATDPVPSSPPLDTGTLPTDSFFNPTDTGNQGLQAQDVQASVGNDPVMSAATFAPTDNTNIFGAQNQGGQDITAPQDNNSAPDANQGGDTPILLATSLTDNQGVPPANDAGNASDPVQQIQQLGQDLNAASGVAAQNVNDAVAQTNDVIQQTLQQPEGPVLNTEPVNPSGDNPSTSNDSTFVSEPSPIPQKVNMPQEFLRAGLESIPVAGSILAGGEAIAGQTVFGRELSNEERAILGGSAVLGSLGPLAREAGATVIALRELAPEAGGVIGNVVAGAGEVASNPLVQSAETGAQINFGATRGFNAATGVDPETTLDRSAVASVGGAAGGALAPGSILTPAAEQIPIAEGINSTTSTVGVAATGGVSNLVGQSVNREGDGQFTLPDLNTQQGQLQSGAEVLSGGALNLVGGATGSAVGETSAIAGQAAETATTFGSNTFTNAVTNALDSSPAPDNIFQQDTPVFTGEPVLTP